MCDDFNTFVQTILARHPGFMTTIHASYCGPGITVLRTEDLANDLVRFLRQVGEQFCEETLRATANPNPTRIVIHDDCPRLLTKYPPRYTARSIDLILHEERRLFDMYYANNPIPQFYRERIE
jgi:hypothetical protein